MKIAVVGCGYVGLVSGVALASVGHGVIGIEVADARRRMIEGGKAPFHEPGVGELLQRGLESGRFRVSGEMGEVGAAEIVLLAVQTPPDARGSIDLSFLESATREVMEVLRGAPEARRVLVVRSTVVPGTADGLVAPIVAAAAGAVGERTAIASNPEFLREGSAMADFLTPDRVVVGCHEEWAAAMLRELYEPLGAPVIAVTPAAAELAKYTSNAFLATLISFSNEIAHICEGLDGVDVEDVLGILHRDHRLSPTVDGRVVRPSILSYLKAGCGYGGSCLPKDISALIAASELQGRDHPLLRAVRAINEGQAERVVDMGADALGNLAGRRVGVLGVAFKSGTDDLRSSPGLRIVDELLARGAVVRFFDPLVSEDLIPSYVDRGVTAAGSLHDLAAGSELVIVTTDAPEFHELASLVGRDGGSPSPVVIDGRRALEPGRFADASFVAVGRGREIRSAA